MCSSVYYNMDKYFGFCEKECQEKLNKATSVGQKLLILDETSTRLNQIFENIEGEAVPPIKAIRND